MQKLSAYEECQKATDKVFSLHIALCFLLPLQSVPTIHIHIHILIHIPIHIHTHMYISHSVLVELSSLGWFQR